jgi:hypothetical protein
LKRTERFNGIFSSRKPLNIDFAELYKKRKVTVVILENIGMVANETFFLYFHQTGSGSTTVHHMPACLTVQQSRPYQYDCFHIPVKKPKTWSLNFSLPLPQQLASQEQFRKYLSQKLIS